MRLQQKLKLSPAAINALHTIADNTGRSMSSIVERLLLSNTDASERLVAVRERLFALCASTGENPRKVLTTALTVAGIADTLPWQDFEATVNGRAPTTVKNAVDDIVKILLG